MALKFSIADPVEVPGPLRSEYRQGDDGRWYLDVEGESPRLAEFRKTNIDLLKERDSLNARLAELAAKPDATKQAAELESQLSAERAAHDSTRLRHATTAEFLKNGGRPSAVDYVADAAAKVFTVEDGKITSNEFSETDPSQPLTLAEFILQKSRTEDYCFLPSRGGGARPSPTPKLGQRSNQGVLRNPTPQQLGQHAADIASGKLKIEYE